MTRPAPLLSGTAPDSFLPTMTAQAIPSSSRNASDEDAMCVSPSPRYPAFGSLGNSGQFYPGCSPGTLLGPLDIPEFFKGRPGSFDQAGSLIQMLSASIGKAGGDMAKDYTCCGLRLADLHALVEHFEEKHVLLLEEPTPGLPNATNAGPTTSQTAIHHGSSTVAPQNLLQGQQTLQQPNQAAELDVESMDLDDSTQSEPPSSTSTTGPSTPLTPVLPFDTTSLKVPSAGSTLSGPNGAGLRLELAFNRYAHYNEFSSLLPGTLKSPLSSPSVSSPNCASPDWARHVRQKSQTKDCTTPSLLSSPVASIPSSPTSSTPGTPQQETTQTELDEAIRASRSTLVAATPTNPFAKPFTCPRPNCTKSYKQSNGLKYHLLHGACSYTPPDPSLGSLTPFEAEKKLKPYKCQVEGSGCERRYKNMNGLRYHYAHSGAHGEIGMRILVEQQAQEQKEKAINASAASGRNPISFSFSPASFAPRPPVNIAAYPPSSSHRHPSLSRNSSQEDLEEPLD